ncbi:glycerophosphoryl diester phosphodiesterase [Halanaerobium congolense]|uniref:Glycerophosphoryl diester phosphodiesterase n=1 Tax=Halanaerobium congolense TaxID=54121 RepID=A0A1G6RHF9_9FIRM|nr:glycerophosphodiester phosphodiesterase family protein [Halanaerobium congolense]KXS48151.1 MAG: glycerophosphoryl diester phosphodiesterase [Halanaerobium sp. T82-1]PUU89316.1 MAG: glycerophosphoryl diester phosphodiesterase [Halanaerobium sp.]PTX16567.1 glycerophosphoryl diester phosphodiesterase [Halanaerobium congolense]TDX42378.1 glycerophosphoryl diester phosphodiesterase [Halanaerobium congolense]SDD03774.1 glycerophosphoryl diester phosphodiesterase [Halanaerobium congolense]
MIKLIIIITVIILIFAFVYFEFYYLIRPSKLGKKIIEKHNFDYPVLVAHRGSSYSAPESTLPAVKKAVESGVDYIELDVQRTKDGKLVIFHDTNLLRLTNVKSMFPDRENYDLQNFTLNELRLLNYGAWFNVKYPERASDGYSHLTIMTLEQVLEFVDPIETGIGLALELKSPYLYDGIEKEIVDLLKEKEIYETETKAPRILFLSFSPASLKRLADLRPDSPRILLTKRNFVSPRRWQGWLDITEEAADGIGPKGHVSFPWYIGAAHKRGLFVFPYVINRSWQLKIFSWFSADGYITDRAEMLAEFFNRVQEFGESVEEFSDNILEEELENTEENQEKAESQNNSEEKNNN